MYNLVNKKAKLQKEEMMIKTIIFDIGNVLVGFAWKPYFESFGYTEDTLKRIEAATVGSVVWNEYDRGYMTDGEILEAFIQNDPGIEKELRESLANIKGMLIKYDYAIPWIQDLKGKGYQVLVLSNFSHKACKDCAEALDFLPYTDGGILSYQDHVIKPDAAIYELLLSRYRLLPSECVFMDDIARNVEGALAAGMHSFVFQNREQALEELRALGVK